MSQQHPSSEELFAYRDGELDHERRGLIEAHVLSCTSCQARIDAISDAEGVLREQSGEPEAAYLDQVTDAVMARVAKEPAGDRAVSARESAAPARARPGRRRNFEDAPLGRAPGLPWPAILSTASAAAAVVVVVMLLIQRPEGWRPSAPVAEAPDRSAVRTEPSGGTAPDGERGALGTGEDRAAAADGAASEAPAATNELPETEQPASIAPLAAAESPTGSGRKASVPAEGRPDVPVARRARTDEVQTQSATEALPEIADRRPVPEKKDAPSPAKITGGVEAVRQEPARDEGALPGDPSGPTYDEVVARHGLPSLYDPLRVRPEALLRAEPEIRVLYQTGGAGADSARARIYLAEAARVRAGENLDAETFDTIVHHYRRALRLARDPATARAARRRLEDFVSRSAPNR